MKKTYVELSRILAGHFPDLAGRITGSMDEPPEFWVYASQVTSLLQIFGMAFAFLGDGFLEMIGITHPPKFLRDAQSHKMAVFFALFFLNNYASSHLSTGAFEVVYNGVIVTSKLETGRMPSVRDVVSGVEGARNAYWAAQGAAGGGA